MIVHCSIKNYDTESFCVPNICTNIASQVFNALFSCHSNSIPNLQNHSFVVFNSEPFRPNQMKPSLPTYLSQLPDPPEQWNRLLYQLNVIPNHLNPQFHNLEQISEVWSFTLIWMLKHHSWPHNHPIEAPWCSSVFSLQWHSHSILTFTFHNQTEYFHSFFFILIDKMGKRENRYGFAILCGWEGSHYTVHILIVSYTFAETQRWTTVFFENLTKNSSLVTKLWWSF